jgi:hypothetical protein
MLTSIQFDGQGDLRTGEVEEKWRYGMLAAELQPQQRAAPQMTPQEAFGVGGFTPQLPRERRGRKGIGI